MAKQKTKEGMDPTSQLTSFLKQNKDDHFNFEESVDFSVTQGSLLLDLHVGKITPGIIRHTGVSRGGKTSQMLEDVKNFLQGVENARCIWVLAEGRLGKETKKRSGLKFTHDPETWEDGSVFVFECQVYEAVFDLVRSLIRNNPENKRYFFVIDSTNGLKRREDLEKASGAVEKVAGAALITSDFLSRVSLAMSKFGHVCGLIGQVRSTIRINPYEKGSPQLSSASGGAAQDHYPTIFLEFQPKYKSDLIGDPNDPSGHWCKVNVIKTDKERTLSVKYPIKYNSTGTSGSVWLEYEIASLMMEWGFVKKAGAWLSFSSEFLEEAKLNSLIPENSEDFKLQGEQKLRDWLEENEIAKKYLFEKFQSLLS
jgi:hypothetical protein|tara:strand:+ start:5231 stop:6334 length:1104 start_codon:yes stop_codon:yes gene_type:complete